MSFWGSDAWISKWTTRLAIVASSLQCSSSPSIPGDCHSGAATVGLVARQRTGTAATACVPLTCPSGMAVAEARGASYFVRIDERRFLPTEHTAGAWSTTEQHFSPLGGLLTHAV